MCSVGYVVERYEPSASSETIRVPGAARSGFTASSNLVGPREL
jgi:hypothetical protein